MLKDGETTFQELVKTRCPFYYDLYDIMNDRASMKPKALSYDLSHDTDDTDVDAAVDDDCDFVLHHTKGTLEPSDIHVSDLTGDGGFSDLSDTDGGGRATPSSSRAKRLKKLPVWDDEAISILGEAHKRSVAKMEELVRHHKMIETMESRKFELEMKKAEREEKQAAIDSWKGKSAELDYKMNLLKRYKEMRDELRWDNNQILAFCPDMEEIIYSFK